jgi:hypothetical protein
MTDKQNSPRIAALQALEASYQRHRQDRLAEQHAAHGHNDAPDGYAHEDGREPRHEPGQDAAHSHSEPDRPSPRPVRRLTAPFVRHRRKIRNALAVVAGTLAIVAAGVITVWLRLAAGPIELDLATPWLSAAIQQNFGGRHAVEVGGTLLERDQNGRTSLRIRDIVVRDADNNVVAAAPKAEVGVSGTSLLMGRLRAKRLSLVGAELAIRIEPDGQVTVSAGADRPPLAITPAVVKAAGAGDVYAVAGRGTSAAPDAAAGQTPAAMPAPAQHFAALLAWLDQVSAGREKGGDMLGELGLVNGVLTVDDRRTGKTWTFDDIDLSVTRPQPNALRLRVGSENAEQPWLLTASIAPSGIERRTIQIEARKVPAKELLLAARLDKGRLQADMPLSAVVRAEIGMDGVPQRIEARIVADAGTVGEIDKPESQIAIDRAEFNIDWDAERRTAVVPFQIVSGGNRITLLGRAEAPREAEAPWRFGLTGGTVVLVAGAPQEPPLILNRIVVHGRFDAARGRLEVEQGEAGNTDLRVAFSGHLDNSSGEPRLAAGLAATQMSATTLKRIWPVFVTTKVRNWVLDHVDTGTVERLVIAANAPIETMKEDGPPLPDGGLSIDLVASNVMIRPVDGLPPIRDADLTTRIAGRNVSIALGRGTVEMATGRKLAITNGVFEVPDTFPKSPPARVRFRIEGPVPAAAELLAMDRLREASGVPVEPATSRGTLTGQVTVALPIQRDYPSGTVKYAMTIDIANFAAERMMLGQKVEAAALRVTATTENYLIKSDVKINGTPASLEYRKFREEPGADVRIQATLDDAARARFGLQAGSALSGPIAVKLGGKVVPEQDTRLAVEADLTQAKIDNLLPGWVKPAGRTARATLTLVGRAQGATRLEEIAVEGAGVNVKGQVELDAAGDIVAASFPVFSLSPDADRSTIKAERGNDGALRVVMRGDVYDAAGFIKSTMGTTPPENRPKPLPNIDLDVRLGAVIGFNGEALRGVELKLSRRGGQMRHFVLNAKIGRDSPFTGDLRRLPNGRQVMNFETGDAGALFRFTDMYARVFGGQLSATMDPPTPDHAPQHGELNMRNFVIRGEPALDRVVAGAGEAARNGVEFTRMRVDYTRVPGRLTIRDGVVRGPVIGATMDGIIDFLKSDVRLRGTFVPLYGLNNAFGQIPIVGLILGGSNEGLLGITYEVVGPPNAPVLRVNPISAIAPGLLRKFFEFPAGGTPAAAPAPSARGDAPVPAARTDLPTARSDAR